MKLRPLAERNALGLDTPAKKLHYALHQLIGATYPSPKSIQLRAATAATPAVIGNGTAANPQTPAVPAKPAVMSPVVSPLPDWIGSIAHFGAAAGTGTNHSVKLYLPYCAAAEALGFVTGSNLTTVAVELIQEITASNYDLGAWVGSYAPSPVTEAEFMIGGKVATVEQYAYANALLLPQNAANKIEKVLYQPITPNRLPIPAVLIDVVVNLTSTQGGET